MPQAVVAFAGYNARSPTLRLSECHGDCLGPDWQDCIAWIDGSAEILSGDYVQLGIKYSDGTVTHIIKRLETTRDLKWWCICDDGVFEVGTLVQPFSIKKVVARESMSPSQAVPMQKKATEEERAYFAELAKDAIAEWQEKGYRRNVVFPGLAAVNYGQGTAP